MKQNVNDLFFNITRLEIINNENLSEIIKSNIIVKNIILEDNNKTLKIFFNPINSNLNINEFTNKNLFEIYKSKLDKSIFNDKNTLHYYSVNEETIGNIASLSLSI